MSTGSGNKFYHLRVVVIPSRSGQNRNEVEYNLSTAELERRFAEPYRKNTPIAINGRTIPMPALERIKVYATDVALQSLTSANWDAIPEVTNDFFSLAPGTDAEAASSPASVQRPAADTREVFVVHGRNAAARDAVFDFLRSLDLHPLEWSQAVQLTQKPMPYIGEILDAVFSQAHAAIILLTPDDEARLHAAFRTDHDPRHEVELTGQARPNVLFEAGMAMGRSPDRTIIVEIGELRPFSDVAGLHVIRLNNSSQRRQELAQRLELAGCPVNRDGTAWHVSMTG